MQQAPEQGPMHALSIGNRRRSLSSRGGEWSLFGIFADILLPFMYLLDECFGFLFVGEGKTSGTFFEFKGVKEGPILIIREVIVDFLVPNHTLCGRLWQ